VSNRVLTSYIICGECENYKIYKKYCQIIRENKRYADNAEQCIVYEKRKGKKNIK